jgi:hypothetical protein
MNGRRMKIEAEEPLVKLRVPLIYNLRRDPFERVRDGKVRSFHSLDPEKGGGVANPVVAA